MLVLLRDAHTTSKVKLVQGNVAATIARMKTCKIQTVCLAKMAKEKRSVHVLQKESDAPRSANAATAEIRSRQEESLHWVQEENEEEKQYPATTEN